NGVWGDPVSSTSSGASVGSHRLEVHLSGSSIEVWSDYACLFTYSDSTWSADTVHGLTWAPSATNATWFDNFSVKPLATAPITSITISPSPSQVVSRVRTVSLSSVARDASNNVINTFLKWSLSDSNVGYVNGGWPFGGTMSVSWLKNGFTATVTAVSGECASL